MESMNEGPGGVPSGNTQQATQDPSGSRTPAPSRPGTSPSDLRPQDRWDVRAIESALAFDDIALPGEEGAAGTAESQPGATPSGGDTAQTKAAPAAPIQLPQELAPLAAEYGVDPKGDQEMSLNEMMVQLREARQEIDFLRNSDQGLQKMTAEELNEKIKELRDDDKYVEADELLRKWKETPKTDKDFKVQQFKKAEANFMAYSKRDQLDKLMSRPEVASEMDKLLSGMDLTDKRMPRLIHLAAIGLLSHELMYRGMMVGRNSSPGFQPPVGAAGSEGKYRAEQVNQPQFNRAPKISELFAKGR